MSAIEAQRSFYRERVPEQFNRTFEKQVALAETDVEAARLLGEMRAVRASIRVEIEDESDPDLDSIVHHLDIDDGEMKAVVSSSRAPFFVLRHSLEHFENLSRRCGTSVLGFLGSMAGLSEEMLLTSQRVRNLRDLKGSLLFEVGGIDGFSLVAGFGVDAATNEPDAAIRLTPEIFGALQSGQLDAQDAFLDEKIDVAGNMEIAIGAALAALSPE